MDYKERLRLAKEALESGSYDKDTIEYIFPELRESEDERMKKSFIRLVKAFYDVNFPTPEGFERKDMIAWLEKQVKNNIGISEATKLKLEDNLNKALEKETPESWNEFLDEQGEQKPSEDEDREYACQSSEHYTRRELMIYNLGIADGKRMIEDAIKETEQKPAWSEENTKIVNNLISELTNLSVRGLIKKTTEEKYVDFLKALKDRVQPQPKQEWSEEDKRELDNIYQIIDFLPISGSHLTKENKDKMLSWLKSLRPQNKQEWVGATKEQIDTIAQHLENIGNTAMAEILYGLRPQNTWKPSDEQMDALNDVISSRGIKYDVLSELWKDLKKLKGK